MRWPLTTEKSAGVLNLGERLVIRHDEKCGRARFLIYHPRWASGFVIPPKQRAFRVKIGSSIGFLERVKGIEPSY